MKKLLALSLLAASSLFAYADSTTSTDNANSIDGYWQTIDDKTGNPKGIMQIYSNENIVYGKVMGGYPINGVVPHQICTKCPSPFTNQPVTGMQIMWGLTYNTQDQQYEDGHILDPDSGSIYHVLLIPSNDNQTLKVHGYIGFPLLGRTQMCYRLTTPQYQQLMKEYPQN
jgi:uncharacterized protein (DUF2147 family)